MCDGVSPQKILNFYSLLFKCRLFWIYLTRLSFLFFYLWTFFIGTSFFLFWQANTSPKVEWKIKLLNRNVLHSVATHTPHESDKIHIVNIFLFFYFVFTANAIHLHRTATFSSSQTIGISLFHWTTHKMHFFQSNPIWFNLIDLILRFIFLLIV